MKPAIVSFNPLHIKEEFNNPALQSLFEKGYRIGTILTRVEGEEGREKYETVLIMEPPPASETRAIGWIIGLLAGILTIECMRFAWEVFSP